MPLIIQIQQDCLDQTVSVTNLLRRAKIAATKLGVDEFLKWINNELEGYNCSADELPGYRVLVGRAEALNPRYGWRPILFDNHSLERDFSKAPIWQSIAPLEELLSDRYESGNLSIAFPPEVRTLMVQMLGIQTEMRQSLSRGQVLNIVSSVKDIILNWTLQLEKSGIIGNNMSFKNEEKSEAKHITQNFYAESIASAGIIQDHATVEINQTINNKLLNLDEVRNLSRQAREEITKLPLVIQSNVEAHLDKIDKEEKRKSPNHSRLRTLLVSLKTICEGAAGNLAAQGITGIAQKLLS